MIYVLYILIFTYCLTIVLLIYGFTKIKTYESIGLKPKTKFTIIVPFRNEAENLPLLLGSFSKLNYPNDFFEIILVDDFSEDRFQVSDFKFQVSVIKNNRISQSPKKDAITTAISFVKTDWIITTDADCLVNENWLLTLDHYIQLHDVDLLAGAVTYEGDNSFLHHFQQLDLASLQGATMGSFGIGKGFMCNGANLAYKKSLFEELNGFEGNDTIASGDDVFLLQKAIAQFPKKVHYLKSSNNIVTTKPLDDWKALFHQRVRWASKTTSYQSTFGKFLGLIVFVGNLALILGIGFWFLNLISFQNVFILFLIKFSVDFILTNKTNLFFRKSNRYLILSGLMYPFFNVSVALFSLSGKYEWKGRKF